MKILVLSDSHSALRFMEMCMEKLRPDAVIHLGDFVKDGNALSELYPDTPFYQVAGNCDRYRVSSDVPETLVSSFCGVKFFMTHGHLFGVKMYPDRLIAEASGCGAEVVLYGHTHEPDCRRLDNGMWILNPGSAGNYGGTAGLITIDGDRTVKCMILHQRHLED